MSSMHERLWQDNKSSLSHLQTNNHPLHLHRKSQVSTGRSMQTNLADVLLVNRYFSSQENVRSCSERLFCLPDCNIWSMIMTASRHRRMWSTLILIDRNTFNLKFLFHIDSCWFILSMRRKIRFQFTKILFVRDELFLLWDNQLEQ